MTATPSPGADLWSWACAAWQTLTLASQELYPDVEDNPQAMTSALHAGARLPMPPTGDVGPPLPDSLWALLASCHAREPNERPSVDECITQLRLAQLAIAMSAPDSGSGERTDHELCSTVSTTRAVPAAPVAEPTDLPSDLDPFKLFFNDDELQGTEAGADVAAGTMRISPELALGIAPPASTQVRGSPAKRAARRKESLRWIDTLFPRSTEQSSGVADGTAGAPMTTVAAAPGAEL